MAAERVALRRAVIVAAALAVVACDAPTYPAEETRYDATQLTGGLVYRWTPGRSIAVYADPTDAPAGFDIAGAVAAAASRWNDATRFADYEIVRAGRAGDADVIVHFRQAPPMVDLLGCEPPGSGAGRTTFCTDTSPARVLPFVGTGGGHVRMDVYVDPTTRTAE